MTKKQRKASRELSWKNTYVMQKVYGPKIKPDNKARYGK